MYTHTYISSEARWPQPDKSSDALLYYTMIYTIMKSSILEYTRVFILDHIVRCYTTICYTRLRVYTLSYYKACRIMMSQPAQRIRVDGSSTRNYTNKHT